MAGRDLIGDGEEGRTTSEDGVEVMPAVVRVFAHGTAWPRTLPPAPPASIVPVTVSHPRLADVGEDELDHAGYRLEGVVEVLRPDGAGDVVDVLVTAGLRRDFPEWWEDLCDRAARVFDLRYGPVRLLLGPVLDAHGLAAGSLGADGRDGA